MESRPKNSNVAAWFEQFHEDMLRRFSGAWLADADVRDLAQEVYLRVLRVKDPELVRHPRAYMLSVAAHVLKEWRRHGDRFIVTQPADLETLSSDADPSRGIDARNRALRVNAALAELPPMYRSAIALHAQYGLTVAQVATHLHVSERMVKRYIEKGYAKLRERLTDTRTEGNL